MLPAAEEQQTVAAEVPGLELLALVHKLPHRNTLFHGVVSSFPGLDKKPSGFLSIGF